MQKPKFNWKVIVITAILGIAAKDLYIFAKEMFWTVKNTPKQDEMIHDISSKQDTIINALRDGYVKKTHFVHYIKRDSIIKAGIEARLKRVERRIGI